MKMSRDVVGNSSVTRSAISDGVGICGDGGGSLSADRIVAVAGVVISSSIASASAARSTGSSLSMRSAPSFQSC